MINNTTNKDYPGRVTNCITQTLNNNFLESVLDPNNTHGVAIGNFMDKDSDDGENYPLYGCDVNVGYVTIKSGTISNCKIYSTFHSGAFALYNKDVNSELKQFIGKKVS